MREDMPYPHITLNTNGVPCINGTRLEAAALLNRATALQRVLCSQDDDLLAIARECHATGVFFSGIALGAA
jgi:hypothetical protein